MKKPPAAPPAQRPFFKCFPSNLLAGCIRLSPDEKAVYYTLLMLLYDAWEPIDDRTVKQRGDLARFCGVSPRAFFVIRDRLLGMPGKLTRDADGRLTNARFERERAKLGQPDADLNPIYPPEKQADKSKINGEINAPAGNDLKGLRVSRTRASPESRVQTEQIRPENGGLSVASEQVVESEIAQICRAMGVDLQASTARHGWAYRWARMRVELDITVGDMIASIETYRGQIKFDDVRSLGLFKDRAIEKRVARTLNDRIAGRTVVALVAAQVDVPLEDWKERARMFLKYGSWGPSYGPSPLMPGCLMPRALLDESEQIWIAQGNHPSSRNTTNGIEPWKPGAGMTPQAAPFAPRSAAA
jgi:hypothetical protein